MRQITILHLCEHFGSRQASFHGVSRSFELWAPAYDKKRFRVLICSREGRSETADRRLRASDIHPLYLGYGKIDPRNLLKLMLLLRREHVDIIQAHGYGACTWGRVAGLLMRIPVIVHERCNYGAVPGFQRPIEWLLGRFTRYAFAVSESTRQFTIDKRYIPARVVKTLYSGIPLDSIRRVSTEWIEQFRREHGRSPSDKVLGIVGRLESHKGHIDAFKALQQMLRERSDVHLWIIGNGCYEDALRRWVNEHGLNGHIRFLGYLSDVTSAIQCLDIQIFPSHKEGTPNTLYEAMAVGNVAVASTSDGQGEILEDGKTALMFTAGDHEAMARQLLRLLSDAALRDSLRRNVLVRIRDFDMQRAIETMQNTYEAIMAKRI
jgi:glycosyltransferase involved in cell wall biosynthesis